MTGFTLAQLSGFEDRLHDFQEQALGLNELLADGQSGVAAASVNSVGGLPLNGMDSSSMEWQGQQLKAIENALERLDSKDYGCCLECKQWVDVNYLNANPVTEYCLACTQSLGDK